MPSNLRVGIEYRLMLTEPEQNLQHRAWVKEIVSLGENFFGCVLELAPEVTLGNSKFNKVLVSSRHFPERVDLIFKWPLTCNVYPLTVLSASTSPYPIAIAHVFPAEGQEDTLEGNEYLEYAKRYKLRWGLTQTDVFLKSLRLDRSDTPVAILTVVQSSKSVRYLAAIASQLGESAMDIDRWPLRLSVYEYDSKDYWSNEPVDVSLLRYLGEGELTKANQRYESPPPYE